MSDLTINELIRESYDNSKAHGFWENAEQRNIPSKLALMHSEISEMLEAFRENAPDARLAEELADLFIRGGDLAGYLKLDLESAIIDKMAKNRARPYKHGKRV